MKLFIDIGGTHIRSEVDTGEEKLLERAAAKDHELTAFIHAQLKRYPKIRHIGIAFAGQVDGGKIISSPNLQVKEKDIKAYFESRYDLTLAIDNDLNCAVLAEAEYWDASHLAALYVGTGLGSAVVDGGRVVRGVTNQSFELGHIPYQTAPFSCGCGKDNCLELFASGSGLKKWAEYHALNVSTLEALSQAGVEGKKIAGSFTAALIHAAAVVITLANPRLLVLGGGIVASHPELADALRRGLKSVAFDNALNEVEIVVSKISHGPLEGAKLLQRSISG